MAEEPQATEDQEYDSPPFLDVGCPGFLERLKNRRCVEEFIRELPGPVRQRLGKLTENINKILDVESMILSAMDQVYLSILNKLNNEVMSLTVEYSNLWNTYLTLKEYWARFQDCPGIQVISSLIEDTCKLLFSSFIEKSERRRKIAQKLQVTGLRNTDLLLKRVFFSSAAGDIIEIYQEFLTGFADCLKGGLPDLNPPYWSGYRHK